MDKLSDALVPAALTGAITGFGSLYVMGSSMERTIAFPGGFNVPSPVAYGLVGAGSKFVNALTRDSIIPYFTESGSMQGLVGIASPIITGTSMVVVASILGGRVPTMNSSMRLFALGAVADAGASYAAEQLQLI